MRLEKAYLALCTAPAGQEPWPAQNMGPDNPGPFQRGWESFRAEQEGAAREAQRKTRRATGLCSLWRTVEVRQRLAEIVAEAEAHADADAFQEEPRAPLPSVQEYVALVTLQTSANFACIARARTEPKQKREADDAVAVPELIERHGEEDDGEADGQIEAAALRAQAGLATMGADTRIVHHFQAELLQKVLRFETAERTQGFVKEFLKTPVMQLEEGLPLPRSRQEGADRRAAHVTQDLQQRYATLSHLEPDELKCLVEAQRKFWKSKDFSQEPDQDCPAPPRKRGPRLSFGPARTIQRTGFAARPRATCLFRAQRHLAPPERLRGAPRAEVRRGAHRPDHWKASASHFEAGPDPVPGEVRGRL
jgi:hypothetical protein